MRRTVAAATLVVSCVLGAAAGVGLHAWWPGWSQHADTPVGPTGSPSTSGTSGPSRAPSSTPTPSATRSRSSSPTPDLSAAPAFTRRALLEPTEFQARGWAVARQVDAYDTLPLTAITPCTTVDPDEVVAGYGATYASNRTTAAEVVARFASSQRAERAFTRLRTAVAGCVDAVDPYERLEITDSHHPSASGISELRWWTTRPLDDGPDRGVVGIVRVDDRIALVSLRSALSNPAETTEITSLLTQAGLRLV